MKIVDINITKKTGTIEKGYEYEGKITLSEDYSFWKKYLLFFKKYEKNIIEDTYHFRTYHSRLYLDGNVVYDACYDSSFSNTNYFKILAEILTLGTNTKSEDECCINKDIVEGHWYYKHDILLGYLLNRDDIEVVDYNFEKLSYGISFKYKEYKFFYISFEINNDTMKIYQKACLNCKTCDNSEEENFIKEFDKWLEKEYKGKQRVEMAKSICCKQ